jgi:4-alpha-glucanotransferase
MNKVFPIKPNGKEQGMGSLKNFGFRHKAGVIMSVSSLPGKYGIGSLGKAAHDFVDFLDATGQTCWQVLPLNPTSYGDSPYQSPSSVAGNPYFIDLDILAEKGLLTKTELAGQRCNSKRVDYGWLFHNRYDVLRLAHSRFAQDRAYRAFMTKQGAWVEDYALFMALKVRYGFAPWTAWAEEHRSYARAVENKAELETEMAFWRWTQYEFTAQWKAVKAHAKEKGIRIIGDMPIYVAHDSMDVWAAPEQFLLDERFRPTVVAGCPPDGFTPDGQLWGNPIYNWPLMQQQSFRWWIHRVGAAFELYDILRIDHFRGFAGYYNVPYGQQTAQNGKWDDAPGIALFRAIAAAFPKAKIIAEDLGYITEDVRELLLDTGFPGMKMLHFAFYDEDSENLPRMYTTENCVVYSSSHDSDCTYTWQKDISGDARKRFNRECPRNRAQSRTYDVIEFAFTSAANLAMVPMQDYLQLSNEEGRMNLPATNSGNWSWRISPRYDTARLRERMLAMAVRNKREK